MALFSFEETGSLVKDTEGVYSATLPATGITRTTGVKGKALTFNGGHLDFNAPVIPDGKKYVSFRFKTTTKTENQTIFCTTSSFGGHGMLILISADGKIRFLYARGDNTKLCFDFAPNTPRLDDNKWHHVIFRWDGKENSTVSVYIDGSVYQTTSTYAESGQHNGNLRVGRYLNAGVFNLFYGSIDELEISSHQNLYLLQTTDSLYTIAPDGTLKNLGSVATADKMALFASDGFETLTKANCETIASQLGKCKILRAKV